MFSDLPPPTPVRFVTEKELLALMTYAMVTTTIRVRFDGRSTGVRLLIKGHYGHSDVTTLAAVTLTYLFI